MPLETALTHFFECLRAGEKPITYGRGNLHVVQTPFALHQSARSGEGRPA